MKLKTWVMAGLLAAYAPMSLAANHVVEMLDMDEGASMVFKPAHLKVEPGDTVTFKPTHKTHFVRAMTAPPGAKKFLSKEDEEFTVTLDEPGLYFYVCPPHMMMAMIGLIQVGDGESVKAQVPAAIKSVENLRGRMMTNADRADQIIAQMKEVQ